MQEREKEKIALKEIEKEDQHQQHTPAHARGTLPPVLDIHTPPSLELLLAFAASRGYTDEDFIRKWHDLMANEYFWCHPVTGQPLNHWPAYFRASYLDHRGNERRGKTAVRGPRRADNWIGTPAESLEKVF